MPSITRGEQRFAAITYSQIALWTGLRLSTVQAYGARGVIPKDDMVKALQWVADRCRERGRPAPWERVTRPSGVLSRELGFWCYKDYLKSDLWKEIRSRLLPASCVKCGGEANQIHHNRYTLENMSGRSTKHLVPLCFPCHTELHRNHEDFDAAAGLPLIGMPTDNSSDNSEQCRTEDVLPPSPTVPHLFAHKSPPDVRERAPTCAAPIPLPAPASGGYNPKTGEYDL